MGNAQSDATCNQAGGGKLYKMMKAQPVYTDDTINFRKSDFVNTLSDRSIIDAIHKDNARVNAPTRNRYAELETQQLKNKNSNIIGGNGGNGGNHMTPVSEGELSAIKNLVMGGGGCGCDKNDLTVSGAGAGAGAGSVTSTFMPETMDLSATSMTGKGNVRSANSSVTSSFMPQTMDLSATSVTAKGNASLVNDSTTSTFMPQATDLSATLMTGKGNVRSVNGSVTSSFMPQATDLSATSVTGKGNASLVNDSATSTFMPQVMNLSATSMTGKDNNGSVNGSVTSSFMPQATNLSATSVTGVATPVNQATGSVLDSAMNRLLKVANLQFGGEDLEPNMEIKHNTTSELINALSLSSASGRQPIDYANIVGGKADDIDESESSTTESTTVEKDVAAQERIKKVEKIRKKKERKSPSSPASSSSSSTTASSMDSSSSVTSSLSVTSSSKSSPYVASVGSLSRNIYLATESMSGGNFIDAKQFYSTEQGELYNSDTNYLRHNINKRRFK